MKENVAPQKTVAFWQLYKNPILLRYMRSRMRWGGLSVSLILTVVITVFTFLMVFSSANWFVPEVGNIINENFTRDAYRAVFLPIFVIQVFIMMFMGTGAVASGITQEYEDGMIEYQRLTPMSPLAKIVGYVIGLPIREWFLLGVTSIAIAIIVKRGEIPMESIWRVYSVFFLSILLYHLLALVVVHSMKRKRVAGRVIQILVLLLYIVLPLLSQFGLIFFEYLTVRPILKEHMLEYLPENSKFVNYISIDGSDASVPFFDQSIKAWNFAMMLQASLVITFVVMLNRRWKDTISHLLSKPFALMFFGYFSFLLLGNTIPLAQRGEMSISKKMMENRIRAYEKRATDVPEKHKQAVIKKWRNAPNNMQSGELAFTQTLFFTISALFGCLVIFICTPKHTNYLVGLRRSRNLKKKWIPYHWDEAPGFIVALAVVAMLAFTLYEFSTTLYAASGVPDSVKELAPTIPITVGYGVICVMAFYLVYEAFENRGLFLLTLFVWVLPIMIMLVMIARKMSEPSIVWVSSVSPFGGYAYGMMNVQAWPDREAFYFSFVVQIIIATIAAMALISKKLRSRKIMLRS